MKIVLIGFMGSGKSSVSKLLSEQLNLKLYELDELLLESTGFKNISEIIDTKGEVFFRDLETKACRKLSAIDDAIISTGGGAIQKEENVQALKENKGYFIFLQNDFKTIEIRLVGDQERPLFRDKSKAEQLYLMRLPSYQALADFTVICDNLSVEEVCSCIAEHLKRKNHVNG